MRFNENDTFQFALLKFEKNLALREPTKRVVASIGFRIYDPLGFLSPFTVKIRPLIQSLWSGGIGWDSPLPEDLIPLEKDWLQNHKELDQLYIERKLFPRLHWSNVELHLFGDASEVAYGAVGYLRIEYGDHVACRLQKRDLPTSRQLNY